jgi:glycerol-1-phosphatase
MKLIDRYDAFLVDLDGVVWRGEQAIAGAADTVTALRSSGKRVVFVTNNASRLPRDYAAKLMRMRVPTEPADVITSAHAVVDHLRAIGIDAGDRVHVCGTDSLVRFVAANAFAATRETNDVAALVVAWNPQLVMDDIRRAADVARSGVPFVGANRDATYPTEDGLVPGSGSILAAVEVASGRTATVVGKPSPGLIRVALARAGSDNALFIGDRADSDVAGAHAAGLPVALVLTGVTRESDLPSLVDHPEYILDSIADVLDADPSAVGIAVHDGSLETVAPEGEDQDQAGDEAADVSQERDAASLFDLP